MPTRPAQPVLIWIGRFSELSGYGSSARTYFEVARRAEIPTVAVDSNTIEVVGPSCGLPLRIEKTADGLLHMTAPDQDTRFAVVLHETPPHRERVRVDGRVRLINYTVFETDGFPQAWVDHALDFDEIWTASDFNRQSFASSGIPAWMIRCVPHAIDPALEAAQVEPMRIPGAREHVLLSVLSAFNRKDAGGLLRAYRQAFTSRDPVTLVLKVRPGTTDEQLERYLWGPARPEMDPRDPDAPHVLILDQELSDERMWSLYRRADACVSLERGKGWDLPSMEAMALGTPVVALGWGGIEAFADASNALIVPHAQSLVSADPTLAQGHTMYAAHRWATYAPSDAAAALRRIIDDQPLRTSLAQAASQSVREKCSADRVAGIIAKRLDELTPADDRSDAPATIVLAPHGMCARPLPQPPGVYGAHPVLPRRSHPPEITRLLAHLRQVRQIPLWKPRHKLERLEAMMAAYHSAKAAIPSEHPVTRAFERFAGVPRTKVIAKARAYLSLARDELNLLFAASDMSAVDPLEPYNSSDPLDDWVRRRKDLWVQTGGIAPSEDERARLATLRNRFEGQKIVIMGNGPSLRGIDLDALKGVHTFAANRISLAYEHTAWRPTFYTCLDWRVTPDNYREINALTGSTFFFPNRFNGLLRTGPDVYWYHSINRTDRWREQFETNATHGVRGLGTVVTAMLQLAWHMGFREFVLIGVDASYSIPDTVLQTGPAKFATGHRLELTSTADDDANHFDPRYFGAGKRWHDPNVDEMIRCFAICRKCIEIRGGRIVNATPGGRLEVFDRVNLDQELGVRALCVPTGQHDATQVLIEPRTSAGLATDPDGLRR